MTLDSRRGPPSRILLVHNYYDTSSPSGENVVVQEERRMLESRGHPVEEFSRSSDGLRDAGPWRLLTVAARSPWNARALRELRGVLTRFEPDVMHVHNTFPLLSPAVFHAARGRVARVLTLHNYRMACAAGTLLRDGRICTECLDRPSVIPALWHGCYRGSGVATIPVAATIAHHRRLGTWRKEVEAFICLSEFQRRIIGRLGVPGERLHVKPNFFPGDPEVVPWDERKPAVLFVGRLSPEKGVQHLLAAWSGWDGHPPELRIVGSGPLRSDLEAEARSEGLRVRFLGLVPKEEAVRQIARAHLVVVPSICYEGFPMVIREAFALGTPVAASRLGPLPDILSPVSPDLLFAPGSPSALLDAVRRLRGDPGRLEELGRAMREQHEGRYSESINYRQLMNVYDAARRVASG
jgi:glycosyltransferase involved in cell wall biosynthesis